jgi:hypothetical protein
MISRSGIFSLIVIMCTVNGLLSPWLVIAFQVVPILMPELFPRTVGWSLFFSSIFIATGTMFVSGIIPALYERFFPAVRAGTAPMWIWLTVATLLSLPALESLDKLF